MISPQKHGKFRHREPGYVRCSQSPALGSVSPMARDISKLLELAEERVARSERFLRTQRELIETLRRLGYETADANALLLEYDGFTRDSSLPGIGFERSRSKAVWHRQFLRCLRDNVHSADQTRTASGRLAALNQYG